MHSDVRPQLVMRSVRTCRNKDTSRCVCVCLGTSHCEPWGQTLQHVLVPGFPQQQRQGCTSLTFSLCECDLKGSVETLRANEKVRSCDVVTESAVFSSFVLTNLPLRSFHFVVHRLLLDCRTSAISRLDFIGCFVVSDGSERCRCLRACSPQSSLILDGLCTAKSNIKYSA